VEFQLSCSLVFKLLEFLPRKTFSVALTERIVASRKANLGGNDELQETARAATIDGVFHNSSEWGGVFRHSSDA